MSKPRTATWEIRRQDIDNLRELVARMSALPLNIAEAIPQMRDGHLICRVCGNHEKLDPEKSAKYLREGWPKCHDQTMQLMM